MLHVRRHLEQFPLLDVEQRRKLLCDVQVFIAERRWEGCGGLTVTDEMKVAIAAQACLLTLALDIDLYDGVTSILVYPAGYLAPDRVHVADGVALEGHVERIGEAWYRGPVVLSWADVAAKSDHDDFDDNLVLHEFAHQLDMRLGASADAPPLGDRAATERWRRVMRRQYERLVRAAESGRATLLDQYGATDASEFFAVATECFFQEPVEMRRQVPDLYAVLCDFYRQDPAQWSYR
jgi:hypothetical protein